MKVRCIKNKVSSLSKEVINKYDIQNAIPYCPEDGDYVVYAFSIVHNCIHYCILPEGHFFPRWKPAPFFEVIDNRLSRYWVFGLSEDRGIEVPMLSFPEWANDDYFYGEFVEGSSGDPNAIIFYKYKELMDFEFSDPSITAAQIGDENWLICLLCIDAWESKDNLNGLVRCPKCLQIYNNPRHKNEWPYF